MVKRTRHKESNLDHQNSKEKFSSKTAILRTSSEKSSDLEDPKFEILLEISQIFNILAKNVYFYFF